MKKKIIDWQIVFGIVLILLSIIFYVLHYLIFRDPHHIFIYLLGDLAFVFIQVLLVSMVIERLFQYRETKERLEKLNMLIGVFFSEVGHRLLVLYTKFDANAGDITKDITLDGSWNDDDFKKFKANLRFHNFKIDLEKINLEELRNFLYSKREFMLRLLENPILLEHERFTSLLWAVFHLAEELHYRDRLKELPRTDYEHLSKDIIRVYDLLLEEWIRYIEHLKENYPYLYSLVLRTNPFDPNATIEVKQN
ncbi:MAG: hypothetical protein N3A65_08620 [candidate division WOR-3 bacterium]|nr:hypothetical protein [candidate division WOR-3 bacterium]